MTKDELILGIAQDLLEELDANPDGYFSMGEKQVPYKQSANEIRNLTELGNELVFNYIKGNIRLLKNLKQKPVKES